MNRGVWNDVDYLHNELSNWGPKTHIERIRILSLLLRFGDFYGNEQELLIIILNKALDHWRKNNYESVNWWHNSIGSCTILGESIILVKDYMSDDNLNYFTKYIDKGDDGMSGANQVDYAWFHLLHGISIENDSIINRWRNAAFDELKITPHEGIQVDNSFLSSDIRYIGGYAEVYLMGIIKIASVLKNTKYQISSPKLSILRQYFLETYIHACRSYYFDWNGSGRQISRKYYINRKKFLDYMLTQLPLIDIEHREEYDNARTYIENKSNTKFCKYYYRSEYLLACNDRFSISVGGTSSRIKKPECGNGENLKGSLLSLGSTSYRIIGDEYYNIFNCWNWVRIPGVSATTELPPFKKDWGEYGNTLFSGGVSNGQKGMYSFILDEYGLKGLKSYYLTDYGLICLGNSLESNGEITTTLDQCRYRGTHLLFNNESRVLSKVLHNNIWYVVLSDNHLNVEVKEKDIPWSEINIAEIEETNPYDYIDSNNKTLLTLSIADNDTHDYAYAVIPTPPHTHNYKNFSKLTIFYNGFLFYAMIKISPQSLMGTIYMPLSGMPIVFLIKTLILQLINHVL